MDRDNPKGETLTITLHEVLADVAHELGSTRASRRTASRPISRSCWPRHPIRSRSASPSCGASTRPPSARSISCAATPAAQVVAIEVKRRGEIDGVEQLARYIERLHLDSSLGPVRGVFVAQTVKPQARVLAEARGFTLGRGRLRRAPGLAPRRTQAVLTVVRPRLNRRSGRDPGR